MSRRSTGHGSKAHIQPQSPLRCLIEEGRNGNATKRDAVTVNPATDFKSVKTLIEGHFGNCEPRICF